MLCTFANLDEASLSAINEFEVKAGRTLLAYTCKDIGIDAMSPDEVSQLKRLEDKLCVQLVAVK